MAYGYPYGYEQGMQGVWFPRHPPPDPPELPDGASPYPRWPAWYAPAAFFAGVLALLITGVPIAIFSEAAGADVSDPSPALTLGLTVVQDLIFIVVALVFASFTLRPKAWHFGLRKSRFWPTVGWASLGFASFFIFQILYGVLFQPDGDQSVAEDLGANDSTAALIMGAVLVIVIAPIAEEFFFRGFFYRALRNRLGIWIAATIDGLVFGAIHYTDSDTLPILPLLMVLGFTFCLVYEKTGTLFAPIALHAVNNTIAYAVVTDNGVGVALAFGAATIAGCMLAPRFVRGPTAAMR